MKHLQVLAFLQIFLTQNYCLRHVPSLKAKLGGLFFFLHFFQIFKTPNYCLWKVPIIITLVRMIASASAKSKNTSKNKFGQLQEATGVDQYWSFATCL
jgi:hypothetical protein